MREFKVLGGHAKPLWAGHPWVHADALQETTVPGAAGDDLARVTDRDGKPIGWGLVSDGSAIRVRLVAWGAEPPDVDALLDERIRAACALRTRLFPRPAHTNVYRLVHAEGDGLPGLVVDRFADVLVAQFATRPIHRRRERLAATLREATGARTVLGRTAGYEETEGIPPDEVEQHVGDPAPAKVRVVEEGMVFDVEPQHGQKTGHFADQRENRVRVAELCGARHVLDLYAGTGGFSVQALRRGAATAVAVEASARAATTAAHTARLNGVGPFLDVVTEDVRAALKRWKAEGRRFDVVVCDPPNFFPRRGGPGNALKAYRDLNVQALTRVADGGLLATFTCSAKLPPEPFLELLRSCARECRRRLRVLRELQAGPDHPVLAAAGEGRYLTGFLAVVE